MGFAWPAWKQIHGSAYAELRIGQNCPARETAVLTPRNWPSTKMRSNCAYAPTSRMVSLVHPLLGRVAAQIALARGADAMHAGAVGGKAGAWAIIGAKGAGKSTLLASLDEIGIPIVTDDVLMFAGSTVMAGPRCIDLRPDAQRFGLGMAVRPTDPRNRIALAPIAAEHQLAGVIHLEWSSAETTLEPLDHREAIRRLLILRSDKGYPRSPHAPLDLGQLPTMLLKRPRSMRGLDSSAAHLERLLLQSGADRGPRRAATSAVSSRARPTGARYDQLRGQSRQLMPRLVGRGFGRILQPGVRSEPSLGAVTPIITSCRTPWRLATAGARAPLPGTSVGLGAGRRQHREQPRREPLAGPDQPPRARRQASTHVTEAPIRPPARTELTDTRRPTRHEFRSPRSFSEARNSLTSSSARVASMP